MPLALLDALVARDEELAERLSDYRIPSPLSDDALELFAFRRHQLAADATWAPWGVRAMVRRADRVMVGYVNFHGPPGINDVAAPGAVEIGWTVFPEFRGQGYATETATALMTWAASAHGIRRFISSTTPDNSSSLRVHEKLGFVRTGEIVEGEVIFALER